MQILDQLRQKFAAALIQLVPATEPKSVDADQLRSFSLLVRPTTDARHGDYQANCAMPLGKLLGQSPRTIAEQLVQRLDVSDLCLPPEIAGPGFINLKLKDEYLSQSTTELLSDPRLGIPITATPRSIIIDYSSPNVAKPMHVGHIRSTVIGDALAKIMRFLGHRVITDNHLGDWGTQFGMVIYGFKHFGDEAAFEAAPVAELSRLYRLVNRIIDYHNAIGATEKTQKLVDDCNAVLAHAKAGGESAQDAKAKQVADKAIAIAEKKSEAAIEQAQKMAETIAAVRNDKEFLVVASQHSRIAIAVLEETAKLHEGSAENMALWHRFLPYCKDEIKRVYDRLNVRFDYTLGESFYHPMLGDVVSKLRQDGLASDSEGAVCVFLPEFDAPMIVQKRDGAFLYATTDIATLIYRRDEFRPDEILYVVDTRQSEHFDKLFVVAQMLGLTSTRLVHVNFGTVLGNDGRPFKTRSGSSVGLEALLDDAVARALDVVCDPERSSRIEPPLTDEEKQNIANIVGHGAIKYADLLHHRTSDYRFDLEKMVSLDGNTSAYIQYAFARVQGILAKGNTDENAIAADTRQIMITHPAERFLALQLLRFGESLDQVRVDYAPNFLVDYLYETAKAYAVFNDNCPVLKAGDDLLVKSRLAIVAATGRVLKQGLELLGIAVVPRM